MQYWLMRFVCIGSSTLETNTHTHTHQLSQGGQGIVYGSLRGWLNGFGQELCHSPQSQYFDLQYQLLQWYPQHLRQLVVSQQLQLVLREQVE